ncbi:phosphoribosylformylglycinamidine synthase subunit PurQ [Telmatocola sphagniphila]|jgi:phosphoribosylformylglycinamidine synthase|uniref:Phosphoribosylformylglycinamidine synthase subunit PurQ n=1 Tax=Telmatocola sphagniphila TaxID=1123043 RepID=A0A8E6B705_9BACT|nr:phosphoribosylformylglycinamidine synthase subunit PurQ [Telmatocola sphagniphila]QVL32896.1 phosphoribosylformylglycinamidine synthase subunit PurQ [Telmatocola sphagniphila]
MATPKVLVLRGPGSNCDQEAHFAFEMAGAFVERMHINRLREDPAQLQRFQILCVPGGFTYGDDVAAGKILATQLANFLGDALRKFRDAEKLILGICNGFQAILKAGLILPPDEDGPLATLGHNDSGKFEDRWIHLRVNPNKCVFLKGLESMHIPVAHGEGKFITRKQWILDGLKQAGQVVLTYSHPNQPEAQYPANPNGSMGAVAGLCDATGRVLGLMPHPERHVLPTQHPQWTRLGLAQEGDGLPLFRNAVEYFAT